MSWGITTKHLHRRMNYVCRSLYILTPTYWSKIFINHSLKDKNFMVVPVVVIKCLEFGLCFGHCASCWMLDDGLDCALCCLHISCKMIRSQPIWGPEIKQQHNQLSDSILTFFVLRFTVNEICPPFLIAVNAMIEVDCSCGSVSVADAEAESCCRITV